MVGAPSATGVAVVALFVVMAFGRDGHDAGAVGLRSMVIPRGYPDGRIGNRGRRRPYCGKAYCGNEPRDQSFHCLAGTG